MEKGKLIKIVIAFVIVVLICVGAIVGSLIAKNKRTVISDDLIENGSGEISGEVLSGEEGTSGEVIEEPEYLGPNIFSGDSREKVSFSSLKDELGVYEHNLHDLLSSLDEKGIISYDGSNAELLELNEEIRTVNSNADVVSAELNQKERDSFELIKSLVDENNMVSRYILEGALLYGDLKISFHKWVLTFVLLLVG